MLREDTERLKEHLQDDDFKTQIDIFYKRAYLEERLINSEDLPELLAGQPMLNTETFVAADIPQDTNLEFDESQDIDGLDLSLKNKADKI